MKEILLTARSVTYAQRMKAFLDRGGIACVIVRPDIEITKGSCAYAVNISQTFLPEAIEILKRNKILPVRVILIEGMQYREIRI